MGSPIYNILDYYQKKKKEGQLERHLGERRRLRPEGEGLLSLGLGFPFLVGLDVC